MARKKTTTAKRAVRRRKNSASHSQSASSPPAFDIESPSDVGKALSIMRGHPLTIVLVFANWCGHCHDFLKRWNTYKTLPNRTSPMIAVEQENSEEFLKHIKGKDGRPVSIRAFPTVLASTSRTNSGSTTEEDPTNVGASINTDESSMNTILTQGSAALSTESLPPSESEENANNVENSSEENSSANNASENNASENNAENASTFNESISGSLKESATASTVSSQISNVVRSAVQKASNNIRKKRGVPPQTRRRSGTPFILPPKRYEFSLSGGGNGAAAAAGPSGLFKLQGGGMDLQKSLLSVISQYTNPKRSTRKTQRH